VTRTTKERAVGREETESGGQDGPGGKSTLLPFKEGLPRTVGKIKTSREARRKRSGSEKGRVSLVGKAPCWLAERPSYRSRERLINMTQLLKERGKRCTSAGRRFFQRTNQSQVEKRYVLNKGRYLKKGEEEYVYRRKKKAILYSWIQEGPEKRGVYINKKSKGLEKRRKGPGRGGREVSPDSTICQTTIEEKSRKKATVLVKN